MHNRPEIKVTLVTDNGGWLATFEETTGPHTKDIWSRRYNTRSFEDALYRMRRELSPRKFRQRKKGGVG